MAGALTDTHIFVSKYSEIYFLVLVCLFIYVAYLRDTKIIRSTNWGRAVPSSAWLELAVHFLVANKLMLTLPPYSIFM